MSATLDSIDDALFAALQLLSKANGGVAFIDRYVGQITGAGVVEEELLRRAPALLLSWDGERSNIGWESLAGDVQTEGRSTWSILCVTIDPRDASKRVKGTVGVTGAYKLVGLVLSAMNNLAVPGLLRNENLQYQGAVPVLFRPGLVYVIAARFSTNRAVEQVSATDTSSPYEGTTGGIHLPEAPGAPDPIVEFRSDP